MCMCVRTCVHVRMCANVRSSLHPRPYFLAGTQDRAALPICTKMPCGREGLGLQILSGVTFL